MSEWMNKNNQSNPSMFLTACKMKRGKMQNGSMEKYNSISNPVLVVQNFLMSIDEVRP